MLKTTERWRSRSSIAAATVGSSKMRPQDAMPKFVVSAIEPFWYLWLTTWKSAAAMLDRLLHRSVAFNIDGDSYRMRAHRARAEQVRKGVVVRSGG